MAGGKKKKQIDVLKLAEQRDNKMRRANEHFKKMKKLEEAAVKLDLKISEECTHPSDKRKLKRFSSGIPQKTFWLCTVCYQEIESSVQKQKKIKSIEDTFAEIFKELPAEKLYEE